jgi:hypothetical protein
MHAQSSIGISPIFFESPLFLLLVDEIWLLLVDARPAQQSCKELEVVREDLSNEQSLRGGGRAAVTVGNPTE